MVELRDADFVDIATGGTILGTGGGGSFSTAQHVAEYMLSNRSVKLAKLDALSDDAIVVAIAGMGSPEAMLERPFSTEACHAFDALTAHLGGMPDCVIPLETSGFNFLAAMTVAAKSALPILDADPAGRAIPKLDQTLFFARNVGLAPLAMADAEGNSIVVAAADYTLAERAALAALEHFGWSAGLACYSMDGATAKQSAVAGTISLAREVGRAVSNGLQKGEDPLEAIFSVVAGLELVRGVVTRFDTETAGSYKFGVLEIDGDGSHAGTQLVVKSMNENMLAWKDGSLVAIAPDRVCLIGTSGSPITNADIAVGDSLIVFVIEAQSAWQEESAAALFAPVLRAMGYEGEYVPASELVGGIASRSDEVRISPAAS